jgi:hypothetical protein
MDIDQITIVIDDNYGYQPVTSIDIVIIQFTETSKTFIL